MVRGTNVGNPEAGFMSRPGRRKDALLASGVKESSMFCRRFWSIILKVTYKSISDAIKKDVIQPEVARNEHLIILDFIENIVQTKKNSSNTFRVKGQSRMAS